MTIPHMPPEQFRALGHRLVDWVADYHASLEGRPVTSADRPGDLLARLPPHPPAEPGGAGEWDRIIADLEGLIVPGLTHWQSPNFFGYFPCNHSGPGILAELVSAGLNVNGMLWATSPAATELEMRTLDWMAELIGLPGRFRFDAGGSGGGCIQSTASEATLVSLLAARARALDAGADPAALRLYASRHAHSSVVRAAMIAGLARSPDDDAHLRLIEGDARHRLDTRALAAAIDRDRAAGGHPAWIGATLGTTGSEAIDSLADIAAVAPPQAWLHVDAAYTGAALVCPEFRWMLEGVGRADSLCFNPHKWLLTSFDCDCFWVADRRALAAALSIMPEYLRNRRTDAGEVVDYRDWQVALGRRFRALKLWFVIRHYGRSGLQAHIREHVRLAAWLEARIAADDRFILAAPRVTALVCFRLSAGDDATRALLERVNASARAFLSHTTLADDAGVDRFIIRAAIGATHTREEHVRALWDELSSY
jgi:aromatic-L-amino-acid decarboxylase